MTAEIAIMNQHALVMAADSATTVTMRMQDERQTRYFKGANKLFQLSDHHPVGIMIYNSASLHDVPWELLIRDFRAHLERTSCARLTGYSQRLFEFIKLRVPLFREEIRKQLFLDQVTEVAQRISRRLAAQDRIASTVAEDRAAAFGTALIALRARLRSAVPAAPIEDVEVHGAVAAHTDAAAVLIADELAIFDPTNCRWAPVLAEVAIRDLMTHYTRYLSYTGIVIGGYGDEDYYPGVEAFECYGFLDGRIVCRPKGNPTNVGSDSPAAILSFATTSMIDTFESGVAPDVFRKVIKATESELRAFSGKIRRALGLDHEIADLDRLIDESVRSHAGQWFQGAMAEHHTPLLSVIAALPVSDLAALAKSMIELQSLKERVTKPSESVAGPVDVAVISKHDGFVWLERKHYRAPDSDSRLFVRQDSLHSIRR